MGGFIERYVTVLRSATGEHPQGGGFGGKGDPRVRATP
jgi:hypothetical protein